MPSLDIMSEPDMHEVKNASDQATREISQRYDFRGTGSEINTTEKGFELVAESEDRVRAIYEVLQDKFVKRKLSLKYLDQKDLVSAGGSTFKIPVVLRNGIDQKHAKSIVSIIKGEKSLKVVPSIQGEVIRVSSKKRDDLQEVIALLKDKDFPIELNFGNFRD